MSGGISFSETTFWGKAGWAYRAARDGICDALRTIPEGVELADELGAESHPAQWCEYLDIAAWSEKKKLLFFEAVRRCAVKCEAEGPVGWHDPSFFPGYMRALEELRGLCDDAEKKMKTG